MVSGSFSASTASGSGQSVGNLNVKRRRTQRSPSLDGFSGHRASKDHCVRAGHTRHKVRPIRLGQDSAKSLLVERLRQEHKFARLEDSFFHRFRMLTRSDRSFSCPVVGQGLRFNRAHRGGQSWGTIEAMHCGIHPVLWLRKFTLRNWGVGFRWKSVIS